MHIMGGTVMGSHEAGICHRRVWSRARHRQPLCLWAQPFPH
jgi:hypothetical protein